LEEDVSCVSCAWSVPGVLAWLGWRKGWPCDKSTPGLLHRIVHMPKPDNEATAAVGDPRALTMRIPQSYERALKMLEELALSRRRVAGQQTPGIITQGDTISGITREDLDKEWQAEVEKLV
ncbi:unnamed protein product, partial [Sphacelaria rigidula]